MARVVVLQPGESHEPPFVGERLRLVRLLGENRVVGPYRQAQLAVVRRARGRGQLFGDLGRKRHVDAPRRVLAR